MQTNLWDRIRALHQDQSGQDLVEYAFLAAVIAFGATSSMGSLAAAINTEFSKLGSLMTRNT